MQRRWIAAAAAAAALAAAVPAEAAVDLGAGTSPRVAMDPSGTAHVVFRDGAGAVYCRLPRGARRCDVRLAMPLADSQGAAYILRRPSDGALFVVQSTDDLRTRLTWLRASVNDGASWSAPVAIASGLDDFDDVKLSADGGSVITLASRIAEGAMLQWSPLSGGQTRVFNISARPDGSVVSSSHDGARLAVLRDGRVLAVEETTNFDLLWRLFGGGDPYDQAAWRPFPEKRIRDGNDARAATGPRGTYEMSTRTAAAQFRGRPALRLRALRHGRLTRGRTAVRDAILTGTNVSEDLFEDARGRLHAAWTSTGGRDKCVVYARTGARRHSWFGPSTTLFRTRADARAPKDVRIAATRGGRGIAVWRDEGSRPGQVLHVRATTLRQRRGHARVVRDPFHRPACPRG